MKKNIAIIPARGGSKRIPRKNIRPFCGRPIISYSIEAALRSGLFQEVMVSTDDYEIKRIATEYGAKVPFMRSDENASDYATTASVIDEVLKRYKELNRYFDVCCCIYPAAPFVTVQKITQGYNKLIENKKDCVFPVIQYRPSIQRALRIKENRLEMMFPEYEKSRSQDLETLYHDAGQFYWLNANSFEQCKQVYCVNSEPLILSENECQDIDDEIDWQLAELKYKLIINHV